MGLLEVLRDFDRISEEPFARLASVVEQVIDEGKIRADRVRDAADAEWDLNTGERWRLLEAQLGLPVAA